ncbi:hypothetical protein LZL87_014370 [Fusarium oxysporum]|nr:hypothetical protein LZL87_014370 [Fusarium oxysporum]
MQFSTLFVHGILAVGASASRGQRIRRQDGTVDPEQPSDCTWWETKEEDYQDCAYLEDGWHLTHKQFVEYNPTVKDDCSGMKASNGISTPTPIQSGMIGNCNKFHMVKSTTTCDSIQNYYKISLADFVKWNPAVGSKCTGLWANYNVCVGVIGGTPTKPSNGVTTPSPIQSGMVSNCKKFHPVSSTTTCDSIQKYYKITMAQLVKWNPATGSKCTGLWAKYYVCVGA